MKSIKILITLITVAAINSGVSAQSGEALFNTKCATCHQPHKDGTGPKLFGIRDAWANGGAGEDAIYQWVNNFETAAANDDYAKSRIDAKPANMNKFPELTKEQIVSIFDWVDAQPEKTVAAAPTSDNGEEVIEYVPDYENNLNMFYFLVGTIIIMLFIIIGMSNSIRTLVNSDYFKEKLKAREGSGAAKAILLLIGLTILGSNQSYAMTFNGPGEAATDMPWLQVETVELYYLVGINIVLLGVIFYLRRLFNEFITMVKEPAEVEEAPAAEVLKKVNTILTDVVPIEEEHTILLQHEYDGIRELDNNLPPWWVWGFYASILFAVVYLFNYHILGVSDLQAEAYDKEVKQAEIEVQAYLEKMAMNVDENSATLLTDDKDLSAGKVLFEKNCTTCHRIDGSGDIGPNLTDKNWIYGFDIKDVFKTVKNGTAKGMPSHSEKLNPVQTQQVASYVLTLPETAGKDPEGDIIEK